MASRDPILVDLALQGGGAHGAFTWGALDRLLEDDEIAIEGISSTSAGAMNAAALKHGWMSGGNEGARDSLAQFWLRLAGLDGTLLEQLVEMAADGGGGELEPRTQGGGRRRAVLEDRTGHTLARGVVHLEYHNTSVPLLRRRLQGR